MIRHAFLGCAAAWALAGAGMAAAQPAIAPAALQAAVSSDPVRRFYEARQWQPAWTGARADQLVTALGEAPRHGLNPDDFVDQKALQAKGAAREAAFTGAALGLAEALGRGRADPARLREPFTLARAKFDAPAALQAAIAQGGDLTAWFATLAPDSARYRALSDAYRRERGGMDKGGSRDIPSGDLIRPGDSDPRVPRVAAALRARGLFRGEASGQAYGPALADAVRALQREAGLKTDGVIGPDTLTRLNADAGDRARTLAVNLERLRWLERQPPGDRIDVNTAAAELTYWRGGQAVDRRKVIVGQPGWETPMLGSPIYRLVANPTWTVPKSIEREELAGLSAAQLRARNMERRDGWIVQLSGPDNALGQVKFDMRNDHAIYLHDTPAKSLFDRADRHASHGCVRVEDALGFARRLAEVQGKSAEFEAALASGSETFVPLDRQIPVRLVYLTAYPDAGGQIRYAPDAYGWDDDVAEALGLGKGLPRPPAEPVSDIGP